MNYNREYRKVLKEYLNPHEISLWGNVHQKDFVPCILKKKFGDGKQLISIGTIDDRPKYWLARIDSSINCESRFSDISELSDEILEAIIDEFGEYSYEEEEEHGDQYPAVFDEFSGHHWNSVFGYKE
jgi:hypothetical protein